MYVYIYKCTHGLQASYKGYGTNSPMCINGKSFKSLSKLNSISSSTLLERKKENILKKENTVPINYARNQVNDNTREKIFLCISFIFLEV